jgi:hypothetical protein
MARILKVVGRGVEGRWLVVPPESAYCLRSQGIIATLRRVFVMVSSSRGFVEASS